MRPVRRKHWSSSPGVGRICARGPTSKVSGAVSAFQAATVIAPTYVAAYAGLALAKVAQAANRHVRVEAFGEARAAALRAVALDDESADAQVALGQVMF